MRSQVVLGLGFGDEGKGITTDFLCAHAASPLVIRFSGGHQAGHTVVVDGKRHVFSSFGSGTLRGAATYWSRYCTFSPADMIVEREHLLSLGVVPTLYVDALAPVTTFYDMLYNRLLEQQRGSDRHGSVGTGFGCTVERHLTPYKLHSMDIGHPLVLRQKLDAIGRYYADRAERDGLEWHNDWDAYREMFLQYAERSQDAVVIVSEEEFLKSHAHTDTLVFEGSQGILLDMDYGFFPNVTRAYTTGRNAMEMIHRYGLPMPEIVYVTRCYQTRHGAGWMSNEGDVPHLIDNPDETNVHNEWQGSLRKGILDLDLINYAVECDKNHTAGCVRSLMITCLDQMEESVTYRHQGMEHTVERENIMDLFGSLAISPERVLLSYSEDSSSIIEHRVAPEQEQLTIAEAIPSVYRDRMQHQGI